MKEDKEITMVEIELDLNKETYDKLIEYAKENIVNDEQALLNWGVTHALEEIIKENEESK